MEVFVGSVGGLVVGLAAGAWFGERSIEDQIESVEESTANSVAAESADSDEPDFDRTQREMNDDGQTLVDRSQAQLDRTLKELRDKVVGRDPGSICALRLLDESQVAWENSTNALLALYWPLPKDLDATSAAELPEGLASGNNDDNRYGSIFPMCFSLTKARLIEQRVEHLRVILDWEEGDVCSPKWPALEESASSVPEEASEDDGEN